MRRFQLVSALLLTAPVGLLACDESPSPAEVASAPQPEADTPLMTMVGTLDAGSSEAAEQGPLEVGVLWLNLIDGEGTVLIEATGADALGESLPASFDVSLLSPPSDAMLGTTFLTYGEDGSSSAIDRSRVAFGVVVVAPQGTLAALPESAPITEFISSSEATAGPLLSQFTLVSSYAVRYVQGASAQGLRVRDINGVESPLEDLTVTDLGAWARGIDNAVCRDRQLGSGWEAPEVIACIDAQAEALAAADAAQAACLDTCVLPTDSEDRESAYSDCIVACYMAENGRQSIENGCLYTWSEANVATTEALCGPAPDFAEVDFRNARRLASDEALQLTLGEGDIRSALTHGGFIFIH